MTSLSKREEFLRLRKSGIGGSDVAAVCGLSPWRSPVDVYNDKTSDIVNDEGNDATHWGIILEDVIAKEFAAQNGLRVQRINKPFRKNGWQIANIDRAVTHIDRRAYIKKDGTLGGAFAILEVKTAGAHSAADWGPSQLEEIKSGTVVSDHTIPLYYETQIQWYMGITGASFCYVAVLIGGRDFRVYEVKYNEEIYNILVKRCGEFWKNHVLAHVPPAPANAADVAAVFPKSNGKLREADNTAATIISEYRNLYGQSKAIEAQMAVLRDQLTAIIGEGEGLTIAGKVACTFKSYESNRFDTAAFKVAHPDLYKNFINKTSARRFNIKA